MLFVSGTTRSDFERVVQLRAAKASLARGLGEEEEPIEAALEDEDEEEEEEEGEEEEATTLMATAYMATSLNGFDEQLFTQMHMGDAECIVRAQLPAVDTSASVVLAVGPRSGYKNGHLIIRALAASERVRQAVQVGHLITAVHVSVVLTLCVSAMVCHSLCW